MTSVPLLLHAVLVFVGPYLCLRIHRKWNPPSVLNPVVLCYVLGISLSNLGLAFSSFQFDTSHARNLATLSVVLAIPFMLLSANLISWFRLAKTTALSTFFCFASVAFAATLCGKLFAGKVEEHWKVAGMLVGTYVGSIPNLAAVGTALQVNPESMLLVQTADLMIAGAFLLFVLSLGPQFFGRFLPSFQNQSKSRAASPTPNKKAIAWYVGWIWVILIAACAGWVSQAVAAEYKDLAAILTLSILALALSTQEKIRRIEKTFASGEYLFLSFCVAVGSMTQLSGLLQRSTWILLNTALVIAIAVTLHLLLSRIFRIDRDTFIMTMTAGIFSPAMIGPVAAVLKNPDVVISGMSAALMGLGLGNFLGIAVAYLVK